MLRNTLRKLGLDVVRYPYTREVIGDKVKINRFKLIESQGIDLVLDVGGNQGQYGEELRFYGYKGQIFSFEPLEGPFRKLKEKADRDPNWKAHNLALGDTNGSGTINVAANLESSSIRKMNATHLSSAPESKTIGTQNIEIRRLDGLFNEYEAYKKIYLKLDVQGFERQVLDGAGDRLSSISGIQVEMSLVELYTGEPTFFEQCEYLKSVGFKLKSLEPGFADRKTGQLLQVDGIWFR